MARSIDELVAEIHAIEAEIEVAYEQKRKDVGLVVDRGRLRFSEAILEQQRIRRIGLIRYLTGASLLSWLVAPVIYAGIIPLVLLDIFLVIYQSVCFPVYRISKVKRADYLFFDRADLPYLNLLQKFNCAYCSYGNGIVGYAREIAARTEQYFCPIKHARKIQAAHDRYPQFFEYGDAESYRQGLERLQRELARAENT